MAKRLFIIIKAPNGDVREVPIFEDPVVIGRDESADVRVDDKKISRRHASFRIVDGEASVEDLGSANGIKLNGKKIERRSKFKFGDQIKVGTFQISLKDPADNTASSASEGPDRNQLRNKPVMEKVGSAADPAATKNKQAKEHNKELPALVGLDDPVQGRRFELKNGENIIGRLEECDVPILDGSVSRQHSRLVFTRDRLTVTDLGSSNGTFVNDTRVDMAELAHKDRLRAGNINFDVLLPERLRGRASGPVHTRARPVHQRKPTERRWIVLGAVGLFMAAFVLTTTVLWKLRQQSGGAGFSLSALIARMKGADAGVEPTSDLDAGEMLAVEPPPGLPPIDPPESPPPPAVEPPAMPPPVEVAGLFMPVTTATSPFSRRDETGLPINLPIVPSDFDFESFVAAHLETAKTCEQKGDIGCLNGAISELLERDPINPEAKQLKERTRKFEDANRLLTKADQYEARGDFARALEALMAIPSDVPQFEPAKKRTADLREEAIAQELSRGKDDLKKKPKSAHSRFKRVLELDPSSVEALEGVRAAEKKLRAKNVEFEPFIPARPGGQEPPPPPANVEGALAQFYDNDRTLAKLAQTYQIGKVDEALKKTQTLRRSSRGDRKRRVSKMIRALEKIGPQHQKARAEISNDPNEAWKELSKLVSLEGELLPKALKSHIVRDLESELGEAFGERGSSAFEAGRYEQAFGFFESGFKLDPTNPQVLAGLKKLDEKARILVQEAELASQRGDRDTCERWRMITRIVKSDNEKYKMARARALECR